MSIKSKILCEIEKKPRKAKELKAKIGNDKKVAKALNELVNDGKLICNEGVYLFKANKTEASLLCTIVKLGKGFGFAQPQDGSPDVFVPGKFLKGAMPGDTVLIKIFKTPRVEGSVEGEVIVVVTECNDFVGTIDGFEDRLYLIPDKAPQTPISIKRSADGGAKKGERAAIVILERAENHNAHRAGVAKRFGSSLSAKQCAKSILYSYDIEKAFPNKVKADAKQFENVAVDKADTQGRKNLTDKCIFTIDSASTKDIDDAIHIEKHEGGYVLGVHIADVSHYVKAGSALDAEALKRGTSVYFADSVVPMLPRQLSNGICSLNEGVERLAFSCIMQLDFAGNVKDYSFVKSVIKSRLKGVYEEINAIFSKSANKEIVDKYSETSESLQLFYELYTHLSAKRKARGSMDIESGEFKLILNEEGICVDIEKRQRGVAECMIEEFMLLANNCAANLGRRYNAPFVYRVHEAPEANKIEKLLKLLNSSAVQFKFENVTPSVLELSSLLEKTRGTTLEKPIHQGILRSMSKAKYEIVPKGHFGLALEDYAHFTSPIRRYPDLAIHRILSDMIKGVDEKELLKKYLNFAGEASVQSSQREVSAMTAERDIEDCYKAEYMAAHIGEDLEAIVSSVTPHGIYAELPNTVEGMISINALVKGTANVIDGVSVEDTLSGNTWRLGDKIKVTVAAADICKGQIDFVLA